MIRKIWGCSCGWENNIKMVVQIYVVEGLQSAEWPVCAAASYVSPNRTYHIKPTVVLL